MSESETIDWAWGESSGLAFPAHPEALRAAGPDWLTRAFHAGGALAADNRVTAITALEEWTLGGTGVKARLDVEYARAEPGLPGALFVKFSRNFADRVRDSGRHHMPPEVRLANLSRDAAFPVAVPRCLFADIEPESLTGILITERIPYGEGTVEPHYPKCMDHLLPDPLAHYRVLVANLARLAGAHRAGRLGALADQQFPLDIPALIARRPRLDAQVQVGRLQRLAGFVRQYPQLFPAHLAAPAFLAEVCAAAIPAAEAQDAIWAHLHARPALLALCHMNANIDNAWFWRDGEGALHAGLIDWGSVGQMSVAASIWGCLGAGEPELHDAHLDALVALFAEEYACAGGPSVNPEEILLDLELHAMMSALHMTTAPPAILREIPDPARAADRFDPLFTASETARVQLKVTVALLNLWHRRDLGRHLRPGAAWRSS